MLNLRKVAVTGGLSSGKSAVCRCLKDLGAYVVSADEVVHRLLSPETELGQKILNLLGSECVVNGQFDRAKIANKVFQNPGLLQSYESLIHPFVQKEIDNRYQQVKAEGKYTLFVVEIPLLFETHGQRFYDATIVVDSDEEIAKERFKAKGYDEKEYERRMTRQMPLREKVNLADYVILNNGSLEELCNSVKKNYNQFISNPFN